MQKIKRITNGKLRLREMVRICEKRKICEMRVKNIDEEGKEENEENEEKYELLDKEHGCGCV
jgi:hypothetical protein